MPYKDKEQEKLCRKRNYYKWKQYMQDYAVKNNKTLKEKARLRHVKRYYNLNADEYLQLILDQNNKCAICFREETYKNRHGDVRPLSVDHDHKTGKVRALLCTQCNSLLGHADDTISHLQNAIDYLQKYNKE